MHVYKQFAVAQKQTKEVLQSCVKAASGQLICWYYFGSTSLAGEYAQMPFRKAGLGEWRNALKPR